MRLWPQPGMQVQWDQLPDPQIGFLYEIGSGIEPCTRPGLTGAQRACPGSAWWRQMRGQLVNRFGDPPRWTVRCDDDSHDVPHFARHADPVSICRSAQTINVGPGRLHMLVHYSRRQPPCYCVVNR